MTPDLYLGLALAGLILILIVVGARMVRPTETATRDTPGPAARTIIEEIDESEGEGRG